MAIGTQPRLELAHLAGLQTGRGIWADATFQTTDRDIFAAGDAAEVLDPETGKPGIDSLWSAALDHGRAAGEQMCGVGRPYRRPAPFNVTRIGGVTTTLIGAGGTGARDVDLVTLGRGDSNAWREHADAFAVVSDGEANTCASCHGTTAWKPATFGLSHRFPINHGRAAGSCSACHPSTWAGYSCAQCHSASSMATHHRRLTNFTQTTCVACHPTGRGD